MKTNLAARAARWSAAHWKTATFGWLAFVLVAVVLGQASGTIELSPAEQGTGEAAKAQTMLDRAGFDRPAAESVLVHSERSTASDREFRRTVASVVATLRALPQVEGVRSPFRGGGRISREGHSALVEFSIRGDRSSAESRVQPVMAAVAELQTRTPAFTVAEFGEASSDHELGETEGKDFANAERMTVPVTFVILLLAFGAFVAAGIPVLLAFSAVMASIGLSAAASHFAHASSSTTSVILLMGMAVGVDYSLFYVKRERDERRAGHGPDALPRAAATSGQAVLVSGATVLVAMAGMLFSGSKIFTSLGIGAMIVVLTAMIGSLTVLPALLAKLGDRLERGVVGVAAATLARLLRLDPARPSRLRRLRDRRTLIQRLKGDRGSSRAWNVVLRPVLRWPAAAAVVAAGGLLVLSLPVLHMQTKLPGFSDLPRGLSIVQAYERVHEAFPGTEAPAEVVVEAKNVRSPAMQAAIGELERRALATGQMKAPVETTVNPSGTVARIDVPLAGDGEDHASMAALRALREDVLPATLGRVAGARYAVTGETAFSHDFSRTTWAHFPLIVAFVLGLAFVLLLLAFRSIVIPLTAIVLNLLSVAASYGVLVWIFQEGHLQRLLGFHASGGVVTWLPLFMFVVLFGLSMDYHVFIVSRIKELAGRGVPTDEAVAEGIRSTASTVTSAAAVMVAVFAVFASLSQLDVKQLGVGLAIAVLLDATVIRGVLLPATMRLLGEWNWYLPRWLGWIPRTGVGRHSCVPALEVE